jgi:threonine dehydrogenase-like Zn-dependent dehydrogenase
MKVVCYRRSGRLIKKEVPVPEPGEDSVLVKVSDTGFCGSDHSMIERVRYLAMRSAAP